MDAVAWIKRALHRSVQLLLVAHACGMNAQAADLRAYAEQFPPFNFQRDDQPHGLSVELLQLIGQRSGLSIQLEFRPWQRAVNESAEDANSLLLTPARTPQREPHFLWVGPIDPCNVSLIKLARRQDIRIERLDEAFRYRVGVLKAGVGRETLDELGFPKAHIELVPPSGNLLRMLQASRIDLISGLYPGYRYQAQLAGLPGGVKEAFVLRKGMGCYYAFNPAVDPQRLQRFQKAFQALVRDGSLRKLRLKYALH